MQNYLIVGIFLIQQNRYYLTYLKLRIYCQN